MKEKLPESLQRTSSESFSHKLIKHFLFIYLRKHNKNVLQSEKERYFGEHRADLYFKFKSGHQLVIEVQNSPISIAEIKKRNEFYSTLDIYVLWILYAKGKVAISSKPKIHQKCARISPAEHYLHHLYRGRVYYVNIKTYKRKTTITPPYALHFSYSKTFPAKLIKKKFRHYFLRNINYVSLPNWNILFTRYQNTKVGRFYDKHYRRILASELREFIQTHTKVNCKNCVRYKLKKLRHCYRSRHLNQDECSFQPPSPKRLRRLAKKQFLDEVGESLLKDTYQNIFLHYKKRQK
jgi:competence CoiA-like predicted nuclease